MSCAETKYDKAPEIIYVDEDNTSTNPAEIFGVCDKIDAQGCPDGYKNTLPDGNWVLSTNVGCAVWDDFVLSPHSRECKKDINDVYWNKPLGDSSLQLQCCTGEQTGDDCGFYLPGCDTCVNRLQNICEGGIVPGDSEYCDTTCDIDNFDTNEWNNAGCTNFYKNYCKVYPAYAKQDGLYFDPHFSLYIGTKEEAIKKCSELGGACKGIYRSKSSIVTNSNSWIVGSSVIRSYNYDYEGYLKNGDFVRHGTASYIDEDNVEYIGDSEYMTTDEAETKCDNDLNCSEYKCNDCYSYCDYMDKYIGNHLPVEYRAKLYRTKLEISNATGLLTPEEHQCQWNCQNFETNKTKEETDAELLSCEETFTGSRIEVCKSAVHSKITEEEISTCKDTCDTLTGDEKLYCLKGCDYGSKCTFSSSVNEIKIEYPPPPIEGPIPGSNLAHFFSPNTGQSIGKKITGESAKSSKIFSDSVCRDFCNLDDGSIKSTCNSIESDFCTSGDNIISTPCKKWCKNTVNGIKNIDADCGSYLKEYCHDISNNHEMCSCFKSKQFHENIVIQAENEGVPVGLLVPHPKCVYKKCGSEIEWVPQSVIDHDCQNICVAINDVTLNNNGEINSVEVVQDTTINCATENVACVEGGCAGGFTCKDSADICVQCINNEDCASDHRCVNNKCVFYCNDDDDCDSTDICIDGKCVEPSTTDDPTTDPSSCDTDIQCISPKVCENSICVSPSGLTTTWIIIIIIISIIVAGIIGFIIYSQNKKGIKKGIKKGKNIFDKGIKKVRNLK